ncbi:proline dehydrogenase [Dimargaris verticillata]|uniref:Proline dehydrogenase n=1 Tax=Dimargaris verticillata TaxID=2761393 RepID=A0A9W8B4Q3_9FUNG|nr:proline dehydrogenase [Dimargaris verticillata]
MYSQVVPACPTFRKSLLGNNSTGLSRAAACFAAAPRRLLTTLPRAQPGTAIDHRPSFPLVSSANFGARSTALGSPSAFATAAVRFGQLKSHYSTRDNASPMTASGDPIGTITALSLLAGSLYWLLADPKDSVLYTDSASSPLVIPKYSSAEAPLSIPSAQQILDADPRLATRDKSTYELLVSMLVYKACTIETLTSMAPDVLHALDKMRLSPAAYWVIKRTFFAQFCGGETDAEVVDTMKKLKQSSVGAMLDFAIEVDIDHLAANSDEQELRRTWNQRADQATAFLKQCIVTSSAHPGSFSAVKITGISTPMLLQRLSNLHYGLRHLFTAADADHDGRITFEQFYQMTSQLPGYLASDNVTKSNQLISELWQSIAESGELKAVADADWADVEKVLSIANPAAQQLYVAPGPMVVTDVVTSSLAQQPRTTCQAGPYTYESLSYDDLEDYRLTMQRAFELAELADASNVRLSIDAEQSYFQPAIDHVALALAKSFNRLDDARGPLVFNTYQMYLKDGYRKLVSDATRAKREGFQFAVKLVRGAYMVSERKRAAALGIPDPINETIEDTHHSFNSGVKYMIDEIHRCRQEQLAAHSSTSPVETESPSFASPALFVASHNYESVKNACQLMEEYHIPINANKVMFGQLMGMQDAITFSLGQFGYQVYKYIPYGPVQEVMPYLIRRAQENSSVMGGVQSERQVLWSELRQRVTGGRKHHYQQQQQVHASDLSTLETQGIDLGTSKATNTSN